MGKENPLRKLESYGQSIWLDFIRRSMFTSGEFQTFVEQDGISGVTSNPSIFEKAIAGSHDYDEAVRSLTIKGKRAAEIYDALMIEDLQTAADILRPIFDQTNGRDGFVSLEVSPFLAHDASKTVAEAKRYWKTLNRPNALIKVPATKEGIHAIRQLISEGINVNVTLLFGLPRYRDVLDAYLSGLEERIKEGKPVDTITSVASFFLSRIDVLLDAALENMLRGEGTEAELAARLKGEAAIASARLAYQIYKESLRSERFQRLAERAAKPQKLLWASTSTKNPNYSDVKYVEALIGPDTINTLPLETINAYRDHGQPAPRLEQDVDHAKWVLESLKAVHLDIDQATQQLEDEGVQKFIQAYERLMDTLEKESREAAKEQVDRQEISTGSYSQAITQRLESLKRADAAARIWRKDASLWKTEEKDQKVIANALGWLHVADKMEENLPDLLNFAASVRAAGFRHVVHMGMGGSSLAPMVFERIFPVGRDGLPLTILDTTDPTTILRIERRLPLEKTLFIVASKSGTTAEPEAFADYFYDKLYKLKGERAGQNFVTVTDPDTPLVESSRKRGFRRIFLNFADIGGRYSALSYFGLLPAALVGVDVSEILSRAQRVIHACASSVPAEMNPGLTLGAAIGELALRGHDKLTFLAPHAIAPFALWLEQLLAESTGKEGKGILPVAGEEAGSPEVYGEDRTFVLLQLKSRIDGELERAAQRLNHAGYPTITVQMGDLLDIGQEFFRWEFATALAGAVLGINAFDQPNVQESKDNTNRILAEARQSDGHLKEGEPGLREGAISVYGQPLARNLRESLAGLFDSMARGDYVALQAYLPEDESSNRLLGELRLAIRDRLHCATTLGYGPRFLHSTGQYHKGGPNKGVFLQLTYDPAEDVPLPGEPYTFGTFIRAQALGDMLALQRHERRVLRIHLGKDPQAGLQQLKETLEGALEGSRVG